MVAIANSYVEKSCRGPHLWTWSQNQVGICKLLRFSLKRQFIPPVRVPLARLDKVSDNVRKKVSVGKWYRVSLEKPQHPIVGFHPLLSEGNNPHQYSEMLQ